MKVTFLGTGAADWSPKKPETDDTEPEVTETEE
jgi:hypothetical protein